MTIGELIKELESIRDIVADEEGDDLPVRIAYQPHWPLVGCINSITLLYDDDEEGAAGRRPDHPTAVWIAVTSSAPYNENPYAPRKAWRE
jgi:hypothetical protein